MASSSSKVPVGPSSQPSTCEGLEPSSTVPVASTEAMVDVPVASPPAPSDSVLAPPPPFLARPRIYGKGPWTSLFPWRNWDWTVSGLEPTVDQAWVPNLDEISELLIQKGDLQATPINFDFLCATSKDWSHWVDREILDPDFWDRLVDAGVHWSILISRSCNIGGDCSSSEEASVHQTEWLAFTLYSTSKGLQSAVLLLYCIGYDICGTLLSPCTPLFLGHLYSQLDLLHDCEIQGDSCYILSAAFNTSVLQTFFWEHSNGFQDFRDNLPLVYRWVGLKTHDHDLVDALDYEENVLFRPYGDDHPGFTCASISQKVLSATGVYFIPYCPQRVQRQFRLDQGIPIGPQETATCIADLTAFLKSRAFVRWGGETTRVLIPGGHRLGFNTSSMGVYWQRFTQSMVDFVIAAKSSDSPNGDESRERLDSRTPYICQRVGGIPVNVVEDRLIMLSKRAPSKKAKAVKKDKPPLLVPSCCQGVHHGPCARINQVCHCSSQEKDKGRERKVNPPPRQKLGRKVSPPPPVTSSCKGVYHGSCGKNLLSPPLLLRSLRSVGASSPQQTSKKSAASHPPRSQKKTNVSSSSPDEEEPSAVSTPSPPKKKKFTAPLFPSWRCWSYKEQEWSQGEFFVVPSPSPSSLRLFHVFSHVLVYGRCSTGLLPWTRMKIWGRARQTALKLVMSPWERSILLPVDSFFDSTSSWLHGGRLSHCSPCWPWMMTVPWNADVDPISFSLPQTVLTRAGFDVSISHVHGGDFSLLVLPLALEPFRLVALLYQASHLTSEDSPVVGGALMPKETHAQSLVESGSVVDLGVDVAGHDAPIEDAGISAVDPLVGSDHLENIDLGVVLWKNFCFHGLGCHPMENSVPWTWLSSYGKFLFLGLGCRPMESYASVDLAWVIAYMCRKMIGEIGITGELSAGHSDFTKGFKLSIGLGGPMMSLLGSVLAAMDESSLEDVTKTQILAWRSVIQDLMDVGFDLGFMMERLRQMAQCLFGKRLADEIKVLQHPIALLQDSLAELTAYQAAMTSTGGVVPRSERGGSFLDSLLD
uniref:Aminotransferase-like plant mobile domain-containing protein n=1 Tax=Fagus sylvatica TaxID=28930 RepID=A0A2N9FWV1_FAGSY